MASRRLAVLLAGGLAAGAVAVAAAPSLTSAAPAACDTVPKTAFTLAGRYDTGDATGTQTAAEIVAADGDTAYVMTFGAVEVVDISDPANPVQTGTLTLPGDPTSVAVHDDLVAVSVPATPKTDPGKVLFFDGDTPLGSVTVGALPDMVTFAAHGKRLLVANEGEPNSYGQVDSVDPEGSVSVIDVKAFRKGKPSVTPITFTAFNAGGRRAAELPAGVRIFGPGASVAQDLEPEYITVDHDDKTAWVTLQENNAIAVLDLKKARVREIVALGTSDHSKPGFTLDASDQAATIDNRSWPVRGLYMPDGIASYKTKGRDYVVTANEGDARDWPGISSNGEEARRAGAVADLTLFPAAGVKTELGRLNVTPFAPATTNAAGKLTSLYSFGSRSFSIRDADGDLVWDSGDQLECITAAAYPTRFNASNANNTFKNRSDDKGPEPEAVLVAKIDGRQLAFVALERIGGVVVYDVTKPKAPVFQQYLTSRVFDGSPTDNGPEGLALIPKRDSPTGEPLLLVGHEVSGTVTIWSLTD